MIMMIIIIVKRSIPIIIIFSQLLGVAVLGCGIWVLVDKPAFLDLFQQVLTKKTKTMEKTKTKKKSKSQRVKESETKTKTKIKTDLTS